VADLGLGGTGAKGPAVRAADSMGDWNKARDGDEAKTQAVPSLMGKTAGK